MSDHVDSQCHGLFSHALDCEGEFSWKHIQYHRSPRCYHHDSSSLQSGFTRDIKLRTLVSGMVRISGVEELPAFPRISLKYVLIV